MADQIDRRKFLSIGAASAVGVGALGFVGTSRSSAASAATDREFGPSAAGAQRGGTLRFATSGGTPKDTPDPATALSNFTVITSGLLYDTLVRSDVDFNLKPSLATDWSANSSATRWTFRLRSDARFHDGRPVTSKDVAFTIKRVLDPKVGSGQLSALQPFLKASGISTPDAHTIKFNLVSANAFFPVIFTSVLFGIVPADTVDFSKGIGSGPFTLQSFSAAASAEFTRNENYWRPNQPYLDGVRLATVSEDATRVQSLLAGSQDFIDNVSGSSIALLQGPATQLSIRAGGWVDLAAWGNVKPFNNPAVIDAMKYAQNRTKIMNVVAPGNNLVGPDIPVPPNDPFYPHDLKARPYDPDKAKSLLKRAGYRDGLNVTVYAYPGDKLDFALVYKETAKAAGIKVKVVNWPHATYWDQVYMKKPFIGDSWARLHTSTILNTVFQSKSASNESKFSSPHFDKLLVEAAKTTNEARQKAIYGEALHLIDKSAACLIPGWEPQVYGISKKLKGVEVVNGAQSFFNQAYFG